jgi:hypothetical protein
MPPRVAEPSNWFGQSGLADFDRTIASTHSLCRTPLDDA